MKKSICTLSFFLFFFSLSAQKKEPEKTSTYDAAFAKEIKADEHGMRKYVIAFLKAGPNRNQDSATAAEIQKGHMDNISRMANEGKLVVAGPFMEKSDLKGLYIFAVETIEEAKALTETDPAVKAGRLTMELHPWYGAAALVKMNELYEKSVKK